MTPTGSEHPPEYPTKTPISGSGGAECGALSTDFAPIDADLQRVLSAWATLPAALKAAIIDASGK